MPANIKWFVHLIVAATVIEALADPDLAYLKADQGKLKEPAAAENEPLKK